MGLVALRPIITRRRSYAIGDLIDPSTLSQGDLDALMSTGGVLPEEALSSTYASGQDITALRDGELAFWSAHLAKATTPRLLVAGHSVVVGSGASTGAKSFTSILARTLKANGMTVTVTTDGHASYTTTQLLAGGAGPLPLASACGAVVVMCTLNDYYYGVPSATTRTNLTSLIASYRAAESNSLLPVILVAEWKRADSFTPVEAWENYVAAVKAVAAADSRVIAVDLYSRFGSASGDPLDMFHTDFVHPDDTGHAMIAAVIQEALTVKPVATDLPVQTHIDCASGTAGANTNWTSVVGGIGSTLFDYVVESGGSQNDSITFNWNGKAGTYDLTLFHRQSTNRGKYDVYFDGVLAGAGGSFDGYAASATNVRQTVTNFAVSGDGPHTLQFKMASKNASSSSYVGSIHKVILTRTGA